MVALIAGLLRLDGAPADPERVAAMLAAMTPPGLATDARSAADGPVALGALSLAPATPVDPPGLIESPAALTAADLRLHDPGALAAALAAAPDAASGAVEALLEAAFARWGADAPARLHGDFALARWDRAARQLILARDHFGVRPLQYAHAPGRQLAFASLPAALVETGLASRTVDPETVASYPARRAARGRRTLFRAVAALEPAHRLEAGPGARIAGARYWRLEPGPAIGLDTDPGEIAQTVRGLLERATRRRLPATGPVASHLSGGLDSTTVALLAARAAAEMGRAMHGYAMLEWAEAGDPPVLDEAPFVEAARAMAPDLAVHPIAPRGPDAFLQRRIDPTTAIALDPDEPEQAILAQARTAGARVMLSGWGGDQGATFDGLDAEAELFRSGAWALLARELGLRRQRSGQGIVRLLAGRVAAPMLPEGLRRALRRLRGEPEPARRLADLVAPAARAHIRGEPPRRRPGTLAHRLGTLETGWVPACLEQFAQRGARHGIAYAYPMLDLDLLAYVMRLPGWFFMREGQPRRVIRDAMVGILPEPVRTRRDKRLPYPLDALRLVRLGPRIEADLAGLETVPAVTQYLNPAAIRARLAAAPGPEAMAAEIAAATAEDRQAFSELAILPSVIGLARFLAAQPGETGAQGP